MSKSSKCPRCDGPKTGERKTCESCRTYFREKYRARRASLTPEELEIARAIDRRRAAERRERWHRRATDKDIQRRREVDREQRRINVARREAAETGVRPSEVLQAWGFPSAVVQRYRSRGA